MRVIVLAAGQGFQIDGLNKCLIQDPQDGRTVLAKMVRAFAGCPITVVVGYRAIEIMQAFPDLNYVLNPDWSVTNNSYSLALALNDEPCYVTSGDLFFEPELIEALDQGPDDLVVTECRENRIQSAVNCQVEKGRILELYQGHIRSSLDPEAVGLFKISSRKLLQGWKVNCLRHGDLFVGMNLPVDSGMPPLHIFDKGVHRFDEINTPMDYLNLLRASRELL